MKVQSQFIEMFGNNVSKKKISEVCDVRGGSTPTRTTKEFWNNGTIPWFTVEDIYEQGRYISETKQHITELATKKCFIYPVDTVLICCTASVGEYAITKKEMASNQQFNGMMIKDKSELHPEYLLYVASTLKEDLLRQAGKTTINFVSRSKLENIEIPVPPYSEQLGFVSIYQQADKSEFDSLRSEYELKLSFPEGDNIPQVWVSMIAGGDQNLAKQYLNDYVHKLGNLTITGYNSTLSNNSFENKRDRQDKKTHRYIGYRNGLDINKEIAQKETWTIDDITNRTDELVKELLKMYKFPE